MEGGRERGVFFYYYSKFCFFIVEWLGIGGQGSREGVRLYLFILIFCTVEEEGAEVEVFFGIDLVNDNQYWTILINNATKECSTNPTQKAHLMWSNKHTTPFMELQNSCREVVMYYRVLA